METKPIHDKKNQRILVRFCTRYHNLLAFYDQIDSNFYANNEIREILTRLEQNSQKTLKGVNSWLNTLNAGYGGFSVFNYEFLMNYTQENFDYMAQLVAKMAYYYEAHKEAEKTKTITFQTFNLLV